jgi:hypothetical protein
MPREKRTSGRVGHPPFVPTLSERRFVQAMAGLRMSADEICKVVGSGRNSASGGKPISKSMLFKHFRNELANGRSMLKARVAGKFYSALDNDEPWAIQMAMRNQFNWDAGRGGFDGVPAQLDEGGAVQPLTQIVFVVPGKEPEAPRWEPPPGQKLLPAPTAWRDANGFWRDGRERTE